MRTIFKRQKYFSILFILGLLVGLLSLTPAKVVSSSEAGNPNISFNIPLLDESQSFVGNKSNPVSDFALSNLNINHKLSVKAKTASLDLQNTLIGESSRSGYNLDTRFLPAQQQLQIENAYIIVATDQGVYYTKNINNSTPVWYPLNDGFVTSEDKNVYDLWYDETGTEATVGPLWAATASGLWRNANPLGGGTWQKLTPTDPPNLWEDSPAPTAGELSFVKVAGTAGGIVYALAQWQNGSDQYRGWLLKTDSLGQSWSWNAVIKPTNLISNGDFEEGHIDGWTNGYINTDPAYVRNGSYSLRMGPAAWGTTGRFYFEVPVTGVYLAGSWYRQGGTSAWGSVDLNGSGACQIHNSRYGDQWAYNEIACPLSAGTNRIDFNSPPYNGLSYIDDLSVVYSHLYEETKPLSLAFDPNNADKIYVTVYKEGRLYHETLDESLTITESVDFGPATLADVDGRQKYLATYVPEVGVAADTVYAYGRYEIDSQIIHLSQSSDGGTTFERVDDTAGWGNEWLGALYVADENDFVAYTNSLGMLPYHTVDGGSNWTAGNNLVHNIGTAWGDTTSAKGGLVGRYAGAWLSDQALIWQSVTGGPWVDKTGNLYSVSSGTRVQRIIGIDLTVLVYHPDSSFDPDECPPTGCNNNANNFTKRPINTRTGNYNYRTTDLSLTTVGQPLRFERTYNSMTITDTTTGLYTQTLGYGWTHNYDLDLTFADDPGGEEGMAILKAPHGSRLRFFDNGDGTYDPYPGVWAEMTRHVTSYTTTYVITAANQTVYTFSRPDFSGEVVSNGTFNTDLSGWDYGEGDYGNYWDPSGRLRQQWYNSWTYGDNYQTVHIPVDGVYRLTATHTKDLSHLHPDNWPAYVYLGGAVRLSWPRYDEGTKSVDLFLNAGDMQLRLYTAGRNYAGNVFGLWDDVSLQLVKTTPLLRSIRDPQGNLTSFIYTNGLTLTRVTDETSGRYLDFAYDTQDRLTAVTDHAERSVGYGYDADNNLTVYTDTRQLAWTYTYTTINGNPHYLHEVIDPDGRIVEKTFFDSAGRATRQEDGLGQTLASIDYISGDDISGTRVVMENGEVVTDTYDARGVLVSQERALNATETYTETFDFDGSFNRDEVKDGNGNITRYARDAMGLTYAITQTIGGQEITTTFTYDDNNNLESSTDALGRITAYTYEGNNLKTVSNPPQVGGTTVYTYNTAGQTTAVQDKNGNVTRYGYDTLGNRTVITDALGHATTYEYDTLGRVITTTDALNKKTVNVYDPGDNLIKVIENYQDGEFESEFVDEDITTQYGYDGAGRRTVITDTLGRVSRSDYDAAGRLWRSVENVHPTETEQNYQDEYNLTTIYGYDEFGRQMAITDTLNHVSRTFYDEATGRVDHTVTNFQNGSYNPAQPDEDIVTQYLYDANGNVVKTIELPGTGHLYRV